jgi:hypothetical protein
MSAASTCTVHRDLGYSNPCHICGIPADASYFDVADIKPAPAPGTEVELARYALHAQYCGTLLYFAQFADPVELQDRDIFKTPGYEWLILCNNQPLHPYTPTSLILNPWAANAFAVELRLQPGCVLRFVVKKVNQSAEPEVPLSRVGGRLVGRYWFNTYSGGRS